MVGIAAVTPVGVLYALAVVLGVSVPPAGPVETLQQLPIGEHSAPEQRGEAFAWVFTGAGATERRLD